MINKILFGILFVFIVASFATLPRNPLQTDDAALYALAARNAIVHNQWLVQFVTPGDSSSFLDKPPLGVWLLAWFPKIFGVNELTVHFPNVIYYALLLAILYYGLSKLASREIAFSSTLIASTSMALVVYSRAPKLDVLLALFILIAHLSLYAFIKKDNPFYLYLFTLAVAAGFLVKSGFGLIMTALFILFLFVFDKDARQKLLRVLFSRHLILNAALLFAVVGGVLYLQSFALKDQWLPYLKSITIQSKYNTSYLGFGFNHSIFGLLLITLFPWMPLFFSALWSKNRPLNLQLTTNNLQLTTFCSLWFWSNFLFFLFFYRQTDFRTFTILVPPMAILAAESLLKPATCPSGRRAKRRGFRSDLFWSFFYLIIFSIILISLLIKPVNPQGFSLVDAIIPVAFFVVSLLSLTVYFWKPTGTKFAASFLLICLSYTVLFWNTRPIAGAFNEDLKWPGIIKEYREKGYQFFIYRPPDRRLFYSPDLFWVDFMAGPADRYFWQAEEIKKAVKITRSLVLSDTESWDKLKFERPIIIARDGYSSLILINP